MSEPEINRVAFRAPPFIAANPRVWFLQVESQFTGAGIVTDNLKYHSVVAALDIKTLEAVIDVIESPPAQKMYDALKERVLETYAKSDASRLRSLLQEVQLGDRKPSQLLQEMRNLAKGDIKEDILKNLWLQRLPLNIQQILSISNDGLTNLAAIADKIAEITPYTPASINAINNDSALEVIKEELKEIRGTLRDLQAREKMRRDRNRSRGRYRSKSVEKANNYCWYHTKFADKANKCTKPCMYSENQGARRN